MLSKLNSLFQSAWFWLAVLVFCAAMEAIALFYQYALDYGPCVLCIHIRIWIAALIVIALLGLIFRRSVNLNRLLFSAGLLASIGMFERAWKTLGVERGWIIEACSLESGLPDWFALDRWFPYLFEVWESCGYTPELLFGITMAEGLVLTAAGLAAAFFTALALGLLHKS